MKFYVWINNTRLDTSFHSPESAEEFARVHSDPFTDEACEVRDDQGGVCVVVLGGRKSEEPVEIPSE
jgi:hypothetical protein